MDYDHEIKIATKFYNAVVSDAKQFEIRRDDRGYRCGDVVMLREFDSGTHPDAGYTGRQTAVRIKYITDYAQQPGFVVFGFKRLGRR